MIDIALRWLNLGIAVIPIGYRSKRPNTRFLHNGEWKAYQERLPCRGEINEWFKFGLTNMAIVCGWNNLCIVDFDNHMAHGLWKAIYQLDTHTIATGRGYHYYLYIDDFPKHTLKWAGGEIKASGYCLIPPSIHPTGTKYQMVNDAPVMRINSIYDVFPTGLFDQPVSPALQGTVDPYAYAYPTGASCDSINQQVRITRFFTNIHKSGDGWFTVQCPFHGDGKHLSGWIDERRNRYGCHACITGSLSVIDFYMRLNQCDLITAMRDLS